MYFYYCLIISSEHEQVSTTAFAHAHAPKKARNALGAGRQHNIIANCFSYILAFIQISKDALQ